MISSSNKLQETEQRSKTLISGVKVDTGFEAEST